MQDAGGMTILARWSDSEVSASVIRHLVIFMWFLQVGPVIQGWLSSKKAFLPSMSVDGLLGSAVSLRWLAYSS